jgi:hypothetical protein
MVGVKRIYVDMSGILESGGCFPSLVENSSKYYFGVTATSEYRCGLE